MHFILIEESQQLQISCNLESNVFFLVFFTATDSNDDENTIIWNNVCVK